MSNHNNPKQEASEEEYLRYFFENASLSIQERIFLEEGFELCYNGKVPKKLKIDLTKEDYVMRIKDTETFSPPYISSTAPTPVVLITPIIDIGPEKDIKIPKPPKMPELTLMGKVLLDNTKKGEYILMNKKSGEHVSLSVLIDQLKEMTGIE